MKIPPPEIYVELATISDVTVKDTLGTKLSEVKLGNVIQIESKNFNSIY